MALRATAEQEAARESFTAGQDLALVAGAGTGKTSTLVLMGSGTRRRGLYVAFNKPIAEEAKGRFGPNVECRTSHSLAHRAVGRQFQDRLDASRHMPLKRTAQLLGLDRDLAVGKRRLRATTLARLVRRAGPCLVDPEHVQRHIDRQLELAVQDGEQISLLWRPDRAPFDWQPPQPLHPTGTYAANRIAEAALRSALLRRTDPGTHLISRRPSPS